MPDEVVHIIAVVTLEGFGKRLMCQRPYGDSSSINLHRGLVQQIINSVLAVSLQGFSEPDGTNGVPCPGRSLRDLHRTRPIVAQRCSTPCPRPTVPPSERFDAPRVAVPALSWM